MRIISGNFRGKKLLISKDKHTRPLKDNVKESIFNILEHSKLINYKLVIQMFWIYFLVWEFCGFRVYFKELKTCDIF